MTNRSRKIAWGRVETGQFHRFAQAGRAGARPSKSWGRVETGGFHRFAHTGRAEARPSKSWGRVEMGDFYRFAHAGRAGARPSKSWGRVETGGFHRFAHTRRAEARPPGGTCSRMSAHGVSSRLGRTNVRVFAASFEQRRVVPSPDLNQCFGLFF